MEYGLIGEKLGHSFSREIHSRLGGYTYELKEIPHAALDAFMRLRDFTAINVTIPYKSRVVPYLDHVDEKAAKIGAVNTVVKREGKLFGYNTDYFGMEYLLGREGISLVGETVLILGSGGTSLTAKVLAQDRGAKEIVRVGRQAKEGVVDYGTAYDAYSHATILINTTPVGMYPDCDGCPIDITRFPHLKGVVDVVYNPLMTKLVYEAKKRGIPATCGLPMLVAQAVRAAELFLDTTFSRTTLEGVVNETLKEKSHIILIGMPSCGKTTVGREVAERLGRPVIDIDEEIVKTTGCSIPTIFSERGETAFRQLETEVLRQVLFSHSGCVICTGGGVPLKEENREVLARCGRIFWLDRSLSLLTPTSDRPTASSDADMRRRYEERYPIYHMTADVRLDGNGSIQDVATTLIQEFLK